MAAPEGAEAEVTGPEGGGGGDGPGGAGGGDGGAGARASMGTCAAPEALTVAQ